MRKILRIFFVLFLCVYCLETFGQLKVGMYGSLALPIGDFGDINNTGLGGGLTMKHLSKNKQFQLGFDVGYVGFKNTETIRAFGTSFEAIHKYRIIPVKAGFEYFMLTEKIKPFLGMDVGLYFSRFETQTKAPFASVSSDNWEAIGIAPGGGLAYEVSNKVEFNLNIKYNYIFDKGTDPNSGVQTPNGKYLTVNLGIAISLKNND